MPLSAGPDQGTEHAAGAFEQVAAGVAGDPTGRRLSRADRRWRPGRTGFVDRVRTGEVPGTGADVDVADGAGGCDFTAIQALQETIGRVVIPAGTLSLLERSLQRAVDDESAGTGLIRGVVGERAMDMAFFDLPADQQKQLLDTTRVFVPTGEARIPLNPELSAQDRQFLTGAYLEILNDLTKPFPRRLTMQKRITKDAAAAWNRKLAVSSVRLLPLETMASREAMLLVYLRLAQTAVALEHYRADHGGHYPTSLKQMVPVYLSAVPRDPFVSKKLIYQQAGGGYFVYSVGPDGKDHGGLAGRNGESDIVVSMTSPPPLTQ